MPFCACSELGVAAITRVGSVELANKFGESPVKRHAAASRAKATARGGCGIDDGHELAGVALPDQLDMATADQAGAGDRDADPDSSR